MKTSFTSIDEYISTFPPATRNLLQQTREAIHKAAPEAEETISYQIPTFKLQGNLISFAGYKNHIGLYPGAAAIKEFAKEFKGYKTAKGTVQFPLDEPLPLKLVARITAYRVKKNLEKAAAKAPAKKSAVKKSK